MNAERLHAIAEAIKNDLTSTKAVAAMGEFAAAIESLSADLNDSDQQKVYSKALDDLNVSLSKAATNSFSPAWQQLLVEMDLSDHLGNGLKDKVTQILDRNRSTLAVAAEEIKTLSVNQADLAVAINNLVESMEFLGIGAEELSPGECEVGVLIPRGAVHNELHALAKEFLEIEEILKPFQEIATGSYANLDVRSISSSDFGLFVDLDPATCACIAVSVERLVAFYKTLLEIRTLRAGLVGQGLPASSLSAIDDHANKVMSDGIEEIATEVIGDFDGETNTHRKNELKVAIKNALNKLGNRIDKGYSVDVRAAPEKAPAASDDEDAKAKAHYFSLIGKAQPGLQFINQTGASLLSLPVDMPAEPKSPGEVAEKKATAKKASAEAKPRKGTPHKKPGG